VASNTTAARDPLCRGDEAEPFVDAVRGRAGARLGWPGVWLVARPCQRPDLG